MREMNVETVSVEILHGGQNFSAQICSIPALYTFCHCACPVTKWEWDILYLADIARNELCMSPHTNCKSLELWLTCDSKTTLTQSADLCVQVANHLPKIAMYCS